MNKTKVANSTSRINPIETDSKPDSNFVRATGKSVKKQIEGTGNDFMSQLLGWNMDENPTNERGAKPQKSGELQLGVAVSLRSINELTFKDNGKFKTSEKRSEILGGINYRSEVVHGTERLTKREAAELDNRIQEIMTELRRLIGSSGILKTEFAAVSVEDKPEKAGKYYINFFEWLLIEIKKIRMKVEDAGAWLSVMKSKKSQKKYGAMAKKHGTTFTLSNERTAATQTG